jgi:hypothetical protein
MEDRKTLAYDWIKSILPGGKAWTLMAKCLEHSVY